MSMLRSQTDNNRLQNDFGCHARGLAVQPDIP